MTQLEYDEKMCNLNKQMHKEVKGLGDKLMGMQRHNADLQQQINNLKSEKAELGYQMISLCNTISEVKARFQMMKEELYGQRPERTE